MSSKHICSDEREVVVGCKAPVHLQVQIAIHEKISGSPNTSVAPFIEGGEHAEGKKFVTP